MTDNEVNIQMKMKREKAGRWLPWVGAALVLALTLVLYCSWISEIIFVDEQDVFYGGYNVVMSGDLYAYYPSQHMPVSYYLASIGAMLGARTVFQFRLYFYVVMTLQWVLIFLRNRDNLKPAALFSLPLWYLFQLRAYSYAMSMISDHWQGIGLIMILLEMLRYFREKRITPAMAVSIALGVLLSFGSAFLSVYPIFIAFLGLIAMQVRDGRGRRNAQLRRRMLREDGLLIGICLLPFAVMLVWYFATGNLQRFFQSMYTLNLEIYSRYAQNFNASAAGNLLDVFPNWASAMIFGLSQATQNPLVACMALLQLASMVMFALRMGRKDWIGAAAILLTVLVSGVRGFTGFHSAPYLAACSVLMAFCAGDAAEMLRQRLRSPLRWAYAAVAALGLIGLSIPSLAGMTDAVRVTTLTRIEQPVTSGLELLDVLTDPGDWVHTGDISTTSGSVMAQGLRLDEAALASSNPWFYEMYGERELEALKKHKTKIVLLDPDGMIWGYRVRDYAADLTDYIEENYIRLSPLLYASRDAGKDVHDRMEAAGYGVVTTDLSAVGSIPWQSQKPGERDIQYFTADGAKLTACWLQMDAFPEKNRAGMTLEVLDPETGECLADRYVAWDEMGVSGWTRVPLGAALTPGGQYALRMTVEDGADYTLLRLYRTLDQTATDTWYAVADGLPVDYNYSLRFEYAINEDFTLQTEQDS